MTVPVAQLPNEHIGIDFESYLTLSLDAILVADDEGRYVAANNAVYAFTY